MALLSPVTTAQLTPVRPAAAPNFLLAAIDGTGSTTWNPHGEHGDSSVARFYQDLRVPDDCKEYWHGPSDGITGRDMLNSLLEMHEWLVARVAALTSPKIVLVGHSRGGAGCVEMARRLGENSLQVYFMGLYDAVDRTMSSDVDAEVVPGNVATVYHAMRDPSVGSRTSFGNCATRVAPGVEYVPKHFRGTHGAIGGSPEVQGTTQSKLFGASRTSYATLTPQEETDAVIQADHFVRNGARGKNIPI